MLRTEGDIVRASSAENMTSFRYGMKCFFEEGRALAKINHPNVVRVLNFFRANETVYMVMRYERGRTLQQQIQMRQDQMSERLVRHVFMHLLNGLREVHTHKLLHLDIKPANIYLRTDGSPVLLDFGAARQTLTSKRPKLAPMYTPGFAAPEQYREPDRLGPWTDVYGIGASMFACLAAFAPQAADARLAGGPPRLGEEDLGGPVLRQPARGHRLVPAPRPARAPAERVRAAEGDPRHPGQEAQAHLLRQPEAQAVHRNRRMKRHARGDREAGRAARRVASFVHQVAARTAARSRRLFASCGERRAFVRVFRRR